MHDALNGVGVVHDTYPGAETGVLKAVAETRKGVHDDKDWKRWMGGEDGVGHDVAYGSHDCDTALAEFHMDAGIGESCEGVAGEGR